MSDFVLHYDILEGIAKTSNSLGRQADEYANSLTSRVANAIGNVAGSSSGYLEDASYYVNQKVVQLQKKAQEFFGFATQVTLLAETATRVDEEVQRLLAESQETFLQHHESLRIDDWKADILNWLVGIKNKLPFLEVLGNILSAVDTLLDTCLDSIKYWYHCEGGKYIVEFIAAIALAVLVVTLFVLTLPAAIAAVAAATATSAAFVAVCGAIGAGIGAVNALTNVGTSYRAAYTACNGDPTWARIYSKQDTLSEVIRETNFNNGTLNGLSYLGADVIDATEIFCDIIGIVEIGKSLPKLFARKNFNIFKKGSFHLGDFKSSIKNSFGDFKTGIKKDYFDFKSSIKKSFDDTKVGIKKGFTDFKTNVEDGYTAIKSKVKNGLFGKVDDPDDIVELNKLEDVPVNKAEDILLEGGLKSGKELIKNPPTEILSDVELKEMSNGALTKGHNAGLSDSEITNIRQIKNGKKPGVDSYLEKSFQDAHLSKFEENGCYKIISDKRGNPSGTIGAGQEDLFVINGKDVESILQKANGDPRVIEKELAMPDGYLGDNPYLIRADEVDGLRMANGNESNAWQDEWCPAGVTRGGQDEAIINPLEQGKYSYRHCFEDGVWNK